MRPAPMSPMVAMAATGKHRRAACKTVQSADRVVKTCRLSMKTLGIGIAGARYGARLHLANYAALPPGLVELRGVCAKSRESAAALAQKANIAFVTDDYDALLARRDIDVIDV